MALRPIYTVPSAEPPPRHSTTAAPGRRNPHGGRVLAAGVGLALRNITAKWERNACYWRPPMSQFAILYEDRFPNL